MPYNDHKRVEKLFKYVSIVVCKSNIIRNRSLYNVHNYYMHAIYSIFTYQWILLLILQENLLRNHNVKSQYFSDDCMNKKSGKKSVAKPKTWTQY